MRKRRPYNSFPEQWPDRTTTDHRELGYGVPEDKTLTWLLFIGLIILMLAIAA